MATGVVVDKAAGTPAAPSSPQRPRFAIKRVSRLPVKDSERTAGTRMATVVVADK